MTRLEKAKWLKRAKKELVKRFGGTFDGDADSDKVGWTSSLPVKTSPLQ